MTSMIPKQLKPVTNSFLGLWVFLAAFPFFWMFLISFRAPVDAFSFPPKLFAPITFEHFYTVLISASRQNSPSSFRSAAKPLVN